MTLEQVEQEIKSVYVWWSRNAPGVTPQEEGVLADLWSLADTMIAEEDNG